MVTPNDSALPVTDGDAEDTKAEAPKDSEDTGKNAAKNDGPDGKSEDPPLSKNQLKKKRRWERAMEVKKRRKTQEREAKIAKAKAEGRDLELERIEQQKRQEDGAGRRKRQKEWEKYKVPLVEKSFQVCIDCSFEDKMTPKEINSLSSQIRYCYSNNRHNRHPCKLVVTSLGGTTRANLENVSGFDEWTTRAFSSSEKPLEEVFRDRLKDVVYLTSDSENVIEDLDDSKIYVIGGIVDRNRLKRAAITRAEELGIATAKLPLENHLQKMQATKVLTCNHVFEILLKYREHGKDWEKALLEVLPSRKDVAPLNAENSQDETKNESRKDEVEVENDNSRDDQDGDGESNPKE